MKRRIFCLLSAFLILTLFTGCSHSSRFTENDSGSSGKPVTSETSESEIKADTEKQIDATSAAEENNMTKIEIIVENKTFTATLCNNDAAKALKDQLPMALNMSELNGNEKYYYMSGTLPTDGGRPSGIRAGDLMLYGNNCLVLFYESFSTSYSYTPLGHIDDPNGLADALGKGNVQVSFK